MSASRIVRVVICAMSLCGAAHGQQQAPQDDATSSAQQPQYRLTGRVLDEQGAPLPGVEILRVPFVRPSLLSPDHLERLGQTKGDGHFALDWTQHQAANHRANLLFRKKGYANQWFKHIQTWEMKSFRMRRGYTVSGVVQDAAGRPLAGAVVASIDMLAAWESYLDTMVFAPSINAACTTTDAQGRIKLDGVLADGIDLVISHPRFRIHELFAVDVGDPIAVRLQPAGKLSGQVLDRHGRPYPGLNVDVKHDTIRWRYRPYRSPSITDENGRFETPRQESTPYQFSIGTGLPPPDLFTEYSTDDREDFVFQVDFAPEDRPPPAAALAADKEPVAETPVDDAAKPDQASPRIEIELRGSQRGPPIDIFYAALFRTTLKEVGATNANQLFDQFSQNLRQGKRGKVVLGAPFLFQGVAVLAVVTPGYATKLVEIGPDVPAEADRPLRVQLTPESRITGTLIHLATGKPIEGAVVATNVGWNYTDWRGDDWYYRTSAWSFPKYGYVVTDKLGRFSIGNLPSGNYDVFAYQEGSPISATTEVGLSVGQHRQGVVVRMLGPTTLELKLAGVKRLDPSWRVRVGRPYPATLQGSISDRDQSYAMPIEANGTATFRGLAPGEQEIELLVAHPPRLGGTRRKLDVQRITIDKENMTLGIDLAGHAPTPLRGRVDRRGSPIRLHRLIVIAEPVNQSVARRVRTPFLSLQGARSFVGNDGTFLLSCPPGTVELLVVDAATGVIFTRSGAFEHSASNDEVHDLTVEVACLRVSLERHTADAVPGRLEVRCTKLWPGGLGRMTDHPTNDDTRAGAWVAANQLEVLLYLPNMPVELWLRDGAAYRREEKAKIHAKISYVPKPGATDQLTLRY